jgi:ABC-type nitrate/sulfonate/bicarbonate transport system ATPase subunit
LENLETVLELLMERANAIKSTIYNLEVHDILLVDEIFSALDQIRPGDLVVALKCNNRENH